ncbi:MAG TPA: valine--tRNA ligase [Patescibacteria group bacterium]|nr:valine--tRNA ligase [Patescibacteria group bacterium]
MDKNYQPQKVEKKIYQFWEKSGFFTPKIEPKKKPFTILLPLPNANDPLHMGHAIFTVEDILTRYHRMLGEPTLWLPGGDHAGIETQFVFEKELAKKGKSRFDFDRETLYRMIADFAEKNRDINKKELRKMGFSLDWTRYHYSLEPEIIEIVFKTFRKLHQDDLIYRGERIVNYCTHCGTAFSNLEVKYKEKRDHLYYLDYGPLQIATTRPETIFADVAVAVHPEDKRYKKITGKKATIPLINKKIPIITDKVIDIKFGTGALKVTPGHDQIDFEIGQRNNLKIIKVINQEGKMINLPKKYLDMNISQAREETVKDLKKEKKLVKTVPLKHMVSFCYRCGTTIEPLTMPQWFVKTKPLAKPIIKAVKEGKTKIVPKKRFEKMYFDWMENIYDWNISRQIVWGPRIPAWYCLDCNPEIVIDFLDKKNKKTSGKYKDLKEVFSFTEIKKGLQQLIAPKEASYSLDNQFCEKCKGKNILQETDTFDTWFLSGQWPISTLGFPDSQDFKYFYPTSVLDTLWDILFFWVARMMMLGFYMTKEVPFRVVHLHARVVDEHGQKMSKSKGNVISPTDMIEEYGADALRMALTVGVSPGSDVVLSDNKVRAMRNFANKIWNASRFILSYKGEVKKDKKNKDDLWILGELEKTNKKVTNLINRYRFDLASEEIYHFFWHTFCDQYLEMSKKRRDEAQPTLLYTLETSLKLLHPFMPFITEEIYQRLPKHNQALIIEKWPKFQKDSKK